MRQSVTERSRQTTALSMILMKTGSLPTKTTNLNLPFNHEVVDEPEGCCKLKLSRLLYSHFIDTFTFCH